MPCEWHPVLWRFRFRAVYLLETDLEGLILLFAQYNSVKGGDSDKVYNLTL